MLQLYWRLTVSSICLRFSLELEDALLAPLAIQCLCPLNSNCELFAHIETGKRGLT